MCLTVELLSWFMIFAKGGVEVVALEMVKFFFNVLDVRNSVVL